MTVTLEEAKERLEELALAAAGGETVLITGSNDGDLELKLATKGTSSRTRVPQWAHLAGKIPDLPPTSDEFLRLFYGEDDEENARKAAVGRLL